MQTEQVLEEEREVQTYIKQKADQDIQTHKQLTSDQNMQASIQNNFDFTAQANVDPQEAQSRVSNGMTCSEPAHQLRVSNPNQGPPMKIIEESKTSNDESNSTAIPDYEFGIRNDGNT